MSRLSEVSNSIKLICEARKMSTNQWPVILPPESQLRTIKLSEAVAVLAYEKELTFATYKTLAEWLGCYTYILPAQRIISRDVYTLPIKPYPISILNLYNYIYLLSCSFNLTQQQHIVGYIQWLQISKASQLIMKMPLSLLTPASRILVTPH